MIASNSMSESASGNTEPTRSAAAVRLVRSLSSNVKKGTGPSPSSSRTTSANGTETVLRNTNVPQIPNQKLSAFERFVQIWKKKGKQPIFPPVAWFDGQHEPGAAEAAAIPLPLTPTAEVVEEPTGEVEIPQENKQVGDIEEEERTAENEVERPPSPMTFARKIQDMISSLPLPAYSSYPFSSTTKPPSAPSAQPTDDNGADPAQMPPPPGPITDSKLISFLSSASIMNGSISKGRQSVWSVLDRLRSAASNSSAGERSEQHTQEGEVDDDDSSIMMYAPLEPDANSEVEIARSEICSIDEEGEIIAERPGEDMNHPEVSRQGKGKEQEEHKPFSEGKGQDKRSGEAKKVKEIRVWLPSATKISIQAMWWGYRLYLPPPVINTLNNKRLEAAKRAALITTALKWLLDHLPVKLVPPQFRSVLMVLKRLVPYLGYIGAFIAWSWGAIGAFDKGNGVILTATWLLPVALIPGTWEEERFQTPVPSTPRANNSTSDI